MSPCSYPLCALRMESNALMPCSPWHWFVLLPWIQYLQFLSATGLLISGLQQLLDWSHIWSWRKAPLRAAIVLLGRPASSRQTDCARDPRDIVVHAQPQSSRESNRRIVSTKEDSRHIQRAHWADKSTTTESKQQTGSDRQPVLLWALLLLH